MRILFDNGAGGAPGAPVAGFEQSFARFPLPGTTARSWYLAAGGALADAKPARRGPTRSRGTRGAAGDELHRQHRQRHGRPVDGDAGVPLVAEPAGHRGVAT